MKIYGWGTGVGATSIFNEYFTLNQVEGFIDSNEGKNEFIGKKVVSPMWIKEHEFDLILVASNSSQEIYKTCVMLNINLDKIFFVYRSFAPLENMNNNSIELVKEIINQDWLKSVQYEYKVITRNPYEYRNYPHDEQIEKSWGKERDYVRYATTELIAREIIENNIQGDIAEFGVFKGEFAGFLSRLFPDRRILLFDTFESFKDEEFTKECEAGNCGEEFYYGFLDTSIKLVENELADKNKALFVKGYFPKSLIEYPEIDNVQIAICSLDFDFEDGIYSALEWLWPRMAIGGYVLVHDYNSNLRGVKKAIRRFEKDNNMKLPMVPMCDEFGTIVIVKN